MIIASNKAVPPDEVLALEILECRAESRPAKTAQRERKAGLLIDEVFVIAGSDFEQIEQDLNLLGEDVVRLAKTKDHFDRFQVKTARNDPVDGGGARCIELGNTEPVGGHVAIDHNLIERLREKAIVKVSGFVGESGHGSRALRRSEE